jgi:WS/DGAT/MGAT family acyltransferase
MIDGVGSVDLGQTLLDTQPEHNPLPAPAENGDGEPPIPEYGGGRVRSVARRVARPGLSMARAGLHAAESAIGVATHPSRAREAVHRSRALAELIVRDELIAAPKTSLNRPIGAKRRLAVLRRELDELREVKQALGGTVNDVVLASAAGGLRRLLQHRGEPLPPRGLRAMVPMNVRTAGDRLAMGNRISSLFVHLPVAAGDEGSRYELQLEEAEKLKAGPQSEGTSSMLDLTSHMPPVLHSFVARSLFATRLFNVTITNVPGPQAPLYCFGSRVQEIWPLVPIAAEHAIGLAVFSYDGTLYFCLNVDRNTCGDVDVLSKGIEASLDELSELAKQA